MKRNTIQTWEAAACQRSFAEGMVTGAMLAGLGRQPSWPRCWAGCWALPAPPAPSPGAPPLNK